MFPIETGEDKGAAGNTADAAKAAAFIRQRQTAANRGQQLLNIGPLRPTTTSSGLLKMLILGPLPDLS